MDAGNETEVYQRLFEGGRRDVIPWNRRSSKDQNNVKADIDMGKRINPERIWKKERCKVMIWNNTLPSLPAG